MSFPAKLRGTFLATTLLAIMPLIFSLILPLGQANAVSKTWDGGCGGGNTNWSCANNWSDNIVPASGDTVVFNATSTNGSVVDAGFAGEITSISINSGYTGTVTLARSLTVSGTFWQDAGFFTASNQTLTIGVFNLTAGNFTASSGTTSVSSSFTITTPPTFNANGGTINFNGTTTATISCKNKVFNLVTFTHTAGTKTVSNDCSFPLGNNPNANSGGSIINNGTLSGTGTLTTAGTLTLGPNAGTVGTQNNMNGTDATGFGSGGGGAGWYGGMGGDGLYGGGGGGAAGFNMTNRVGGTGGGGVAVFSPVGASNTVRTSGSSYTVPAGVTSIKVWAIGGGGGGAGSTNNEGAAGGAGGAGGVAYKTFSVNPGDTITYSLGSSGAGGVDAVNGSNGGNTTITSGATTITANGGTGGKYNTGATAAGGSFSGGDGGAVGGNGSGANGDTGGGGGGGIGTANGVSNGSDGGTGGQANDVSGLFAVLTEQGYPTTGPGVGGTSANSGPVSAALSGFSGLSASALTVNGIYDFGSYSTFTITGTFTLGAAGVFTAPAGTASFASTFTINSGGTFNANGGTVNFNGTTSVTLSCGSVSFNLVTFTHTAGTKTVGSDCSLPLGANPNANSGGSITLNGAFSGTGTLTTTGTLTLGTTGALSGFSGLVTSLLTINGTYNFGSYSPFTVGSTFSLSATGNMTAPTGTASFAGAFTLTAGSTFNANGGTINFNGATSGSLNCNNASFNLVTFTHTGGTKTVGSTCSFPLGNNPTTTATVSLNGTLSGSGTLAANTMTLGATGVLTGFSGLTATNLTVNGTYDFGAYSPFQVGINSGGVFTVNSGAVFTAPSGTASFPSTFTVNSGATFNANGGTININGTGNATLSCGGKTLNLVTFTHTSGTKTVSSDCSLPLGNNPTIGSGTGNLTLNGTLSGSGTLTMGGLSSSTLTLGTTGVLSGFSGLTAGILTINGTYNFGSYSPLTVVGTFTLNSGAVFTAPSGTASFAAGFTINSGSTFDANGGTVNFNVASGTLACGNKTFNFVTFTHTTGLKTVGSDCSLPLGNNPTLGSGSATVTLNGTLSGSGTLTAVGQLTLGATGALSGFSGLSATSLIVNGTYNFGAYSPFTLTGGFTLNSGAVFTAPSGTASFASTFTINAGSTFNANGGTVNFTGAISATLACGNKTFNLVTFTNTASKIINSDCSLPLGNNPTIGANGGTAGFTLFGTLSGSGTLAVNNAMTFKPGGTLTGFSDMTTVQGIAVASGATTDLSNLDSLTLACSVTCATGFSIDATSSLIAPGLLTLGGSSTKFSQLGTFNANGGTVVLNGTNQTIIGDTTFYNLTKTVSSADTLTFTAGSTQTVQGLLTLQGASGQLLSLVSDTPGTAWLIDAEGTTNVDYVDVADSSSTGQVIVACNSTDSGGNINWSFNPGSCNPPASDESGSSSGSSGSLAVARGTGADSTTPSEDKTTPAAGSDNEKSPSGTTTSEQPVGPGSSGKTLWTVTFLGAFGLLLLLLIAFIVHLILARRRRRAENTDATDYYNSKHL